MKKVFNNNRLILLAFFTVFTTAASTVALANDSTVMTKGVPVELKFLGNVKDQPVFQLNFFGTPEENEFTIVIRDEFGNSVFRELIKGEIFSKKFLLNSEVLGDESVRFEITGRKSKKTVVFEVNRTMTYVEDMKVSTLK